MNKITVFTLLKKRNGNYNVEEMPQKKISYGSEQNVWEMLKLNTPSFLFQKPWEVRQYYVTTTIIISLGILKLEQAVLSDRGTNSPFVK